MRRFCIVVILICLLLINGCTEDVSQNETTDKNTVKWLLPDYNTDEEMTMYSINQNGLNSWLKNAGKKYRIELVSYPGNSEWTDVKKIAEEEAADIVNLPNDALINNPKSYIMSAIEGFCMEINGEYPDSDSLKYKGKLYGYGNVVIEAVLGISYSERYLEETGVAIENLEGIFRDDEASKKFLQEHRNFVVLQGWPQLIGNMYVLGDIFYIDPFSGECGYIFDHLKTKELMEYNKDLIMKGYQNSPDSFVNEKAEEPDIQIFDTGKDYKKYNEMTRYGRRDVNAVFKPLSYSYRYNNVQNIENVIRKDSTNSENAEDFLNEVYGNKALCNFLMYGKENMEFVEANTIQEYVEMISYNENVCNENLIDEPGGWTAERKQDSYKEYCEQYKDSKIEGFQFVIPEELEETYEAVQNIIFTSPKEHMMSAEYSKLLNKSVQWEDAWNSIKEQVETTGGSKIIEELQRQVDAYIAEK